MPLKLFGCSLDVLDIENKVALKRAYIEALKSGRVGLDLPLDPYEALLPLVSSILPDVKLGGKFSLPGWLCPRPNAEDLPFVTIEQYRKFIDSDEITIYIDSCEAWINKNIFPDIPCMIAVDHAMTAAPLKALSRKLGPENLLVVILDAHFDAIPAHFRVPEGVEAPIFGAYHCGSFLEPLIASKIIIPENLYVVGPSDFPPEDLSGTYASAYRTLIEEGITVLPRIKEESLIIQKFEHLLFKNKASHLYISLDADVGAYTCMNAVRFPDFRGLSGETLMGFAQVIRKYIQTGKFQLAGMDVAEVDVHLLGLPGPHGRHDQTEKVCVDFITTVLQGI